MIRLSGIALIWQAAPEGFVIRPALAPNPANPIATRTETWLNVGTQAAVINATATIATAAPANLVVLGPEPILAPARITLSMATASNAKPTLALSIGSDGLKPFQVVP